MSKIHWFSGITMQTKIADIGWSYVAIGVGTVAVAWLVWSAFRVK